MLRWFSRGAGGWGRLLAAALLAGVWGVQPALQADEGMFPINQLGQLDLQSKGLRLSSRELFNPDGVSLIDGICRVNGCTGSFVSPRGLIITNHHCAYRAIQMASSPEQDYLADGFVASSLADEVPAPGYVVRITESYRDVSQEVLAAVTAEMSFLERSRAIDQRKKELEQQAEAEQPQLRAEVAEMFIGQSYFLFQYTFLKDVRLVFAPPASVGNFGGAVDNWEWPRHTGDFSFMRAYVAPDGSSADYSAENVPYQPKRFLQVQPAGVLEEDYVMLLGYPGRTARHRTAAFLRYERDIRLPHLIALNQWEIDVMEAAGRADRAVALKHTSRIQSLANVEKRSRGQLKGLRRAGIIETRQAQEAALQAFIEAEPERSTRYGSILSQLSAAYDELAAVAPRELNERALTSTCRTLSVAFTLFDAAHERQKPDLEREPIYMDRNIALTRRQLELAQKDLDPATDRRMLAELLTRLEPYIDPATWAPLPTGAVAGDEHQRRGAARPESELAAAVDRFFAGTQLADPDFFTRALEMTPVQLTDSGDAALELIAAWYPRLLELRDLDKERDGRLNQLYGELQTVKQALLETDFVPDANGTLRLTFGYVRRFSPEDAVVKTPFTTLAGVIDKTTGEEPFQSPVALLQAYQAGDFGPFVHPQLGQIPVAMLYSTDTTGGNSGSPVLNADGELVGVNFDRAFEATINDFAWNEQYSRSIGVDIRYVLWLTGRVFGAEHLLREMGLEGT